MPQILSVQLFLDTGVIKIYFCEVSFGMSLLTSLFLSKILTLKAYINFLFVIFISILILYPRNSFTQTPAYVLKVMNVTQTLANELEFDIYLHHTNPDSSVFEYATGQYYFDFNSLIANGGLLSYTIVNSDLPEVLQPRNPLVYLVGGAMQLRLSANALPSPGQGYIISNVSPGTKIIRMRLQTTSKAFSELFFRLRWRNGPTNPYTKIYSYIGENYTEITNPSNHLIDSLDHPLPVELNSFVHAVIKNDVKLVWTTNSELNNRGFDIERKFDNENWENRGFVNGSGNSNQIVIYNFNDNDLSPGTYNYRLKQSDFNGNFYYYYLKSDVEISLPSEYFVSQNYPNPFNPETNVDFSLPADNLVVIKLYDMSGKVVKEILNENKPAGYHTLKINSFGLSSGVYFYRFSAVNSLNFFGFTGKMIVVK